MPWLPRYLATLVVLLSMLCLVRGDARADRPEARELVRVGQALALTGERRQALAHFERAIRSDIDYIPAYEAALPLWLALGQLQQARTELEMLTLRCDECVFAWYALGALYRKAGRFDLAAQAYDAYLAKRPRDADGHFGLAMALAARKDPRAAEQLSLYLRLENRPEREVFKERVVLMLRELGGPRESRAVLRVKRAAPIPGMAALIAQGRLASAESVLNGSGRTDLVAVFWRIEIAKGRGQWFQALGYRGLMRLYELR